MAQNEQQIEQMQHRIAESRRSLAGTRQTGPLVVIFLGIALFFAPVTGFGVGFLVFGAITVLLAIVWAYSKSRDATQLKKEIYRYEWELSNLERNLGNWNTTTI